MTGDIWLNLQTPIRGAAQDNTHNTSEEHHNQNMNSCFFLFKLSLLILHVFSKWQGKELCGEHEMENAICHGRHFLQDFNVILLLSWLSAKWVQCCLLQEIKMRLFHFCAVTGWILLKPNLKQYLLITLSTWGQQKNYKHKILRHIISLANSC